MRSMRFGLQARFLAAMAIMLAVVLALLGTLLHRQKIMQQEVADLADAAALGLDHALGQHFTALAQQQATFVLLVLAAAFPRLVFVDAVGQQRITDSPVIAGSALPKALEKERQQFQFERRTAFRAQRFCQGYDLVVTEVERADVVRRHAHHHP